MANITQSYGNPLSPTYPPPPESRAEVNPTLLVSWWCTIFSFAIILVRLGGRWIRTEKLFTEDKIMALAILPLFVRMACVHFVIKYGTNNVITDGLTEAEIAQRVIGSKLVLAARVFYAMFLWVAKLTIADFLHRIYSQMWTRKHDLFLQAIRWFIGLTFLGVFISTLSECQPLHEYWQVVPDPGPSCRSSYSQLITMGAFDGVTDIILVAFPLPIIFSSNMKFERKLSLSLLFSMSLILVGITAYRVQATISHHYSQRFRSLLASFEILAATGVSNAIVLGSFLRDRGVKKNKFKHSSTGQDSVLDRPNQVLVSARSHPAAHAHAMQHRTPHHVRGLHSWGSDIDLVGDLGMRLGPEFHTEKKPRLARPAPAALPMEPLRRDGRSRSRDWTADPVDLEQGNMHARNTDSEDDDDVFDSDPPSPKTPFTPRIDFFDVGGLLSPLNDSSSGNPDSPTRMRGRRRRQSSVSFAPLPTSSSNKAFSPVRSRRDNGSRDPSPSTIVSPRSPAIARRNLPKERLGTGASHAGGLSAFSFPKSPQRKPEEQARTLDPLDFSGDINLSPRRTDWLQSSTQEPPKPSEDSESTSESDATGSKKPKDSAKRN